MTVEGHAQGDLETHGAPHRVPAQLHRAVDSWRAADPDRETVGQLTALLDGAQSGDDAALAELVDAFSGSLDFGTAGLRGRLGPGPNRMNRSVVIRTAAGLARYLLDQHDPARSAPSVVVGYDARHRSADFARDTCAVMQAAGVDAFLLPEPTPTPVLAFAIRDLACSAGVMVTASHNPRQDNGYKVYLGDGSQIAPPVDAEIAAAIAEVPDASAVSRSSDGWTVLDSSVIDRYQQCALGVIDKESPREIRVAYTPLHGVGWEVVRQTFRLAGFAEPAVVSEQRLPDPDFPTVEFPNPEEPGAVDAVVGLAARTEADLVIANDPDADRCAVCVPTADGWLMLSGDEVGVLLASHLMNRRSGTYASTIVSSSWLATICHATGTPFVETLTGFKWLSKVPDLVFAYEEALGYCVDPEHVRDKDGITAALLVVELAATLKREGRTLLDALDGLARDYGLFATSQVSVRSNDLAALAGAVDRLVDDPPSTVAGLAVLAVEDLSLGSGSIPPTTGVRLTLAGGARIIVRPSGTEPKLKCYLQVVEQVGDADVATARANAGRRLEEMGIAIAALAQPGPTSAGSQ